MRRTFRRTTQIKTTFRSTAGFTLIELLVVVSIIGFMALVAFPSVSNFFRISIGSATRSIATTIREAYNATVITGKIHRIVFDLKTQEYWAESGPTSLLLDTESSQEKEERRKRFAKPGSGESPPESPFSIDKTISRKKTPLPRGVVMTEVITEKSKDPITEGQAMSHFFPHGISERTIIHLKDNQAHEVTLVI